MWGVYSPTPQTAGLAGQVAGVNLALAPCGWLAERYSHGNVTSIDPHEERTSRMGFQQTDKHRFGKGSFHQIGLVRGQFVRRARE